MLTAPTDITTAALLDRLRDGALVVFPNPAAARSLRQAFDAAQRGLHLAAWEPPPILTWSHWLDSLWTDLLLSGAEPRLLLNDAQEHTLWRDVVSAKPGAPEAALASADSLADLARHAWFLTNAWLATSRLRSAAATHDTATFADWADIFARGCEKRGFLSRAGLEQALTHHTDAGTLSLPAHLLLIGFDDLTPAQSALLEALQVAGAGLTLHTLTADTSTDADRTVLAAASESQEFTALAHWVRGFLEDRLAANLTARVGILVPSLDTDRAALEATFRAVLAPELQSISADLSSTPWEFASGPPLATLPLISHALDLLRWARAPLGLGSVSALLLSPYIGSFQGRDSSARFDAETLRKSHILRPELDLPLLRLAQSSPYGTSALAWLRPLQTFLAQSGPLDTPRTFADWTEFFRSLTRAANWPGDRDLTSDEYQATQAWDHLLDHIATLDFNGRRVPFTTALHAVERQATQTLFTPPSHHALVQVLTPAQAAGVPFDALILARATDANWPPPEHANPLIGWPLQASLGMPGTSQPRAADRAQRHLAALLAHSGSALITYATATPDGSQRLSPALAALNWPTQQAADLLPPASPPIDALFLPDDDPIPPLPSPEVHGGARVLQLQAACGFRAFAELRLNAAELDAPTAGLDARESGSLLHRTMEHFWREVKSQDALRALSPQAREDVLTRSIDVALDRATDRRHPASSWDQAYLALQKDRLRELLAEWLPLELERAPFTVLESERRETISVGPLELHIVVDRIDQVANGFFLVDYKTGLSSSPRDWLDDRPRDPQLPLYTLLTEPDELMGLAFAKVRAGKDMKWHGYQAEDGHLPKSRANPILDLAGQIDQWRATLTQLAEDFAAGDARVRPFEYPVTCAHCGQRLLCRLDPATLLAVTDDDPSAEEDADG